jgi:Zn finger protein HypA/HybF involved in hydrogenase expression
MKTMPNYKLSLEEIQNSKRCGCYYCCSIFSSNDVEIDDDYYSCPNCGIDSIIVESKDYKLTKIKLKEIKKREFY